MPSDSIINVEVSESQDDDKKPKKPLVYKKRGLILMWNKGKKNADSETDSKTDDKKKTEKKK